MVKGLKLEINAVVAVAKNKLEIPSYLEIPRFPWNLGTISSSTLYIH